MRVCVCVGRWVGGWVGGCVRVCEVSIVFQRRGTFVCVCVCVCVRVLIYGCVVSPKVV